MNALFCYSLPFRNRIFVYVQDHNFKRVRSFNNSTQPNLLQSSVSSGVAAQPIAVLATVATIPSTAAAPSSLLAAAALAKPKVSFRDRIKAMQGPSAVVSSPPPPTVDILAIESAVAQAQSAILSPAATLVVNQQQPGPAAVRPRDSSDKLHHPAIASSSSQKASKPPSTLTGAAISLKDKLRLFSHGGSAPTKASVDGDSSLKPWSKLKMATVVSTGGSYSSLNSSSLNEDEPSPTSTTTMLHRTTAAAAATAASDYASDSGLIDTRRARPLQVIRERSGVGSSNDVGESAAAATTAGSDGDYKRPSLRLRRKPSQLMRPLRVQTSTEPKDYQSVDDLSPEYGGLPFVKRLKILNERQRLAALESAIQRQTRSISLDYADGGGGGVGGSCDGTGELAESLIRCHSEASGMVRPKKSSLIDAAAVAAAAAAVSIAARQQTGAAAAFEIPPLLSHMPTHPLCLPPPPTPTPSPPPPPDLQQFSHQPLQQRHRQLHSPASPGDESNETPERRQLKSILKKLSAEKHAEDVQDRLFGQSLMRAPTLEGYVARHSKLAKSVTFNSTLSSPPASARSVLMPDGSDPVTARTHFPHLQNASNNYGQRQPLSPSSHSEHRSEIHTRHHHQQQPLRPSPSTSPTPPQIQRQLLPQQPPVDSPLVSSIHATAMVTTMTLVTPTQTQSSSPSAVHPAIVSKQFVKGTPFVYGNAHISAQTNPSENCVPNRLHFVCPIPKLYPPDSIEDHEYFSEVLHGIKHVIQNHLREVQMSFQDRFLSLQMDVRQRDVVIDQLQHRIRELERLPASSVAGVSGNGRRFDRGSQNEGSTSSSSSSCDTLFAVGVLYCF